MRDERESERLRSRVSLTPERMRPASRHSLDFSEPTSLTRRQVERRPPDTSTCASATCTLTSVSSVLPHCHDSAHGETLELLKDRMKKRHADAVKAFRMFYLPEAPPNHILQSHFRSVLDALCFPLSDSQFRAILRHCVRSPKGTVDFRHFLDNFVGVAPLPEEEGAAEPEGLTNVRCTLEEAETTIRERALQRLKPLCLAFRTMDHNQDGLVLREELEKVIDNFCQLKFSQDVYQRMWARYDPKDTGLIDYREFLKKLAVNVAQYQRCRPNLNMKIALTWPDVNEEKYNAHKRRLAILTRSDDPCLRGLTLEQIEAKLKNKIVSERALLKRAFLVLDPGGSGLVPSDAFRSVLVHFTYPMSESLFAQLSRRLGLEISANVCWSDFLDRLTSDDPGKCVRKPRLEPDASRNRSASSSLQLSRTVSKLVSLSLVPGLSLRRAFNVRPPADRDHAADQPLITRQELRLIIDKKGNPLSEDEMKLLFRVLDPGHTNLIAYDAFCALFDDNGDPRSREEVGAKKHLAADYHPRNSRLQPISWEKLVDKLKSKVRTNHDTLERALGACDYEQKGWIRDVQLRQILHKFCFRLTTDEFERVLRMVDAVDGVVSVRRFLDTFCQTERECLQKWSSLVSRLAALSSPRPWSEGRVRRLFSEVVGARRQSFLSDAQHLDCGGKGSLKKDELRAIIHRQAARLSDAEFEILWNELPKDKDNSFAYVKFLQEVAEPFVAATSPESASARSLLGSATSPSHGSPEEKPAAADQRLIEHKVGKINSPKPEAFERGPRPASVHPRSRKDANLDIGCPTLVVRPMTAIAGAAKADFQLCKILARRWREMKRDCSALDGRNNGVISSTQFLGILSKYGVPVSSECLLRLLQTKYDVQLDGMINYIHFLRDFFLAIGKRTNEDLRAKKQARATVCQESAHRLYSILLDMRCPILSRWKKLKKAFRRQHDLLGNGKIPIFKFRNTLRDNEIQLSDEDFYELAKYLDRDSEGSVSYNEFLRIFMKTVA